MIYGYARCSTNEKKQDVDRQVRELKEMGADKVYSEYVSGVSDKREKYELLLKSLQPGDTLIATEVSRLTRSTQQLCDLVDLVKSKGLCLIFKDGITLDCRSGNADPMAEAFVAMSGVFAQLEREIIRERVKSGVAAARAKGKKIGRPVLTVDKIPKKVRKYRKMYLAGEISQADCCRACDITKDTFKKYCRMLTEAEQEAKNGK